MLALLQTPPVGCLLQHYSAVMAFASTLLFNVQRAEIPDLRKSRLLHSLFKHYSFNDFLTDYTFSFEIIVSVLATRFPGGVLGEKANSMDC